MSQSTIVIMSVLLIVWTAAIIILSIAFSTKWAGRLRNYRTKALALNDRERAIGERLAEVTRRESAVSVRAAELEKRAVLEKDPEVKSVHSYVVYTPEELLDIKGLQAVTRKKLASRIGYKILELFHQNIREVKDERGRAFRIDFWIKPKR